MTAEKTTPDLAAVTLALQKAMTGTIGVRNPDPEVLDQARQAAQDAASALAQEDGSLDRDGFAAIDAELDADLRAWLLELPSFLSMKEREDQGHELCDLYKPLLGEAHMEAERVVIYLEADKKDECSAHLEKCREQFGEHPWVLMRGAFVLESLGDYKRAREDYERAVERAREEDDRADLRFAYDSLVQFHQNRGDEGRAVEVSRKLLEEMPEIKEEFRTEQIVRETPKVGRNDTCPCGSGKKYKKCHGRAGSTASDLKWGEEE